MFRSRTKKELDRLKKKIEVLEARLEDGEENACEKCGTEYIETTMLGGKSKTYICPRCGRGKTMQWGELEFR